MHTDFKFNELVWVTPNGSGQSGDWSQEDREHIHTIKRFHQELKHWEGLAIGAAFGSYSQDILEVSWTDWICKRKLEL